MCIKTYNFEFFGKNYIESRTDITLEIVNIFTFLQHLLLQHQYLQFATPIWIYRWKVLCLRDLPLKIVIHTCNLPNPIGLITLLGLNVMIFISKLKGQKCVYSLKTFFSQNLLKDVPREFIEINIKVNGAINYCVCIYIT